MLEILPSAQICTDDVGSELRRSPKCRLSGLMLCFSMRHCHYCKGQRLKPGFRRASLEMGIAQYPEISWRSAPGWCPGYDDGLLTCDERLTRCVLREHADCRVAGLSRRKSWTVVRSERQGCDFPSRVDEKDCGIHRRCRSVVKPDEQDIAV